MLSIVIVLAFTGCLFIEKEAILEIIGNTLIDFGASQEFEIKITSSSAGGVGDVFAKDAVAKSVKWEFENLDHSQGTFSKTLEGEEAKKYTATFSTAPGNYRLTVTLTTTQDKTYNKTFEFEVVKSAPASSIERLVDGTAISWNNIQKNDRVELKLALSDSQLTEEQIDNYEYKWEFSYAGKTDSSEFLNYGQTKSYFYTFTDRTQYAVVLKVKDPFGDITSISIPVFTITTTKPAIPELVGTPKWTENAARFEIEVKKGEDVLYYILEKKSADSDQYYFVYRAFASSASTVKLYDPSVSSNEVTYKIYGVDGGQSQGIPLITTLEIPNRPPEKAVVVEPLGVFRKVVFGPNPINLFWINGRDPDQSDSVRYNAYIGNTRATFDFIGSTEANSIPINSKLVSGNTYYTRVDASDGESVTRGDVFSFVFNPDINTPVINSAKMNMTNTPYLINDFNWNDRNVGMGDFTKTYEIEVSRYASFNDSRKFKKTFTHIIPPTFDIPTYVGENQDKMFIRMRIIYENQYMKITTNWSQATLMNIIRN